MASLPCSQCGSSDGMEAYRDGNYCFACNKKTGSRRLSFDEFGKQQKTSRNIALKQLSAEWQRWLEDKNLDCETIENFRIQTEELTNSVSYPIIVYGNLVGYQLRDAKKRIITVRYAHQEESFLFEAIRSHEIVVIVEDAISAMRIWQDANVSAIALLGTNLTPANRQHIVSKFKKVIIWMDGDIAGYKAAQKIHKDCNAYCEAKIIFTRDDPKDYSKTEIKEFISTELMLAK